MKNNLKKSNFFFGKGKNTCIFDSSNKRKNKQL